MEEIIALTEIIDNLQIQKNQQIDNFRKIQDKHYEKVENISIELCKKKAEREVFQDELKFEQQKCMNALKFGGVDPHDPYPEDLDVSKINWRIAPKNISEMTIKDVQSELSD